MTLATETPKKAARGKSLNGTGKGRRKSAAKPAPAPLMICEPQPVEIPAVLLPATVTAETVAPSEPDRFADCDGVLLGDPIDQPETVQTCERETVAEAPATTEPTIGGEFFKSACHLVNGLELLGRAIWRSIVGVAR